MAEGRSPPVDSHKPATAPAATWPRHSAISAARPLQACALAPPVVRWGRYHLRRREGHHTEPCVSCWPGPPCLRRDTGLGDLGSWKSTGWPSLGRRPCRALSSCKAVARPTRLAQSTLFLPFAPGGLNRNTGGVQKHLRAPLPLPRGVWKAPRGLLSTGIREGALGGALGAVGALGWRQAARVDSVPVRNFLLVLCSSGFHLGCPGPWRGTMAAASAAGPLLQGLGDPASSEEPGRETLGPAGPSQADPAAAAAQGSRSSRGLYLACLVLPAMSQAVGEYVNSFNLHSSLTGKLRHRESNNLP